jgi:hypothetical protein
METITISTTYTLKYMVKNYPNYRVTEKGIVINTLRGTILKRVVNGGSKGYWFGKEFKKLSDIRELLIKIEKVKCPF